MKSNHFEIYNGMTLDPETTLVDDLERRSYLWYPTRPRTLSFEVVHACTRGKNRMIISKRCLQERVQNNQAKINLKQLISNNSFYTFNHCIN